MKSSFPVPVTLHPAPTSEPLAVVLGNSNQLGQLPVVLVDPLGRDGFVVHGKWINHDLGDKTDDRSYVKLRARDVAGEAERGHLQARTGM